MKLVSYRHDGKTSLGKVVDGRVVDLLATDPALPPTMRELLRAGPHALARAAAVFAASTIPLADVELLAPIPDPSKFLAIGMNYRRHVEEAARAGVSTPAAQVWFNKQVSCVNDPYGDVHMPRVSDRLDYEVALCVVIGRRCRHVRREEAASVMALHRLAQMRQSILQDRVDGVHLQQVATALDRIAIALPGRPALEIAERGGVDRVHPGHLAACGHHVLPGGIGVQLRGFKVKLHL